jgi:hypothetical protein
MNHSIDRAKVIMRKVGHCQPLRGKVVVMLTNDLDSSLCAQTIKLRPSDKSDKSLQSTSPAQNQTLHALRHSLFREAFAQVLTTDESRV